MEASPPQAFCRGGDHANHPHATESAPTDLRLVSNVIGGMNAPRAASDQLQQPPAAWRRRTHIALYTLQVNTNE